MSVVCGCVPALYAWSWVVCVVSVVSWVARLTPFPTWKIGWEERGGYLQPFHHLKFIINHLHLTWRASYTFLSGWGCHSLTHVLMLEVWMAGWGKWSCGGRLVIVEGKGSADGSCNLPVHLACCDNRCKWNLMNVNKGLWQPTISREHLTQLASK